MVVKAEIPALDLIVKPFPPLELLVFAAGYPELRSLKNAQL